MSDVIFAGTTARQPVGMAEVNLKLTGINGRSTDGRDECTISRRLYRNGESEYLMNGALCRLRDIHELFMDTGLGSKAYSFIEQGKIGQILSNKPTDRRALIEEAAGVTKYRARRRQTQLKLDATQQNLLRVNDIVTEVEKQLESLKRQASKARRRMVLAEEQLGLERIVYGRTFAKLQADSDGLAERAKVEVERAERIDSTITAAETELETGRLGVMEQEKTLEIIRAEHSELTLKANKFETHSTYCRDQSRDAVSRSQAALAGGRGSRGRVSPLSAKASSSMKPMSSLTPRSGRPARRRFRASRRSSISRRGRAPQRRGRHGLRPLHPALRPDPHLRPRFGARRRPRTRGARAGDALQAPDRVRGSVARARARRSLAGSDRVAARARSKRSRSISAADSKAPARIGWKPRPSAATWAASSTPLHRERDQLAGRRTSLEELVATHGAFDAGVRALLDDRATSLVQGVLADAIEVAPEYEKAVEGFLGDALQALVVPNAETARAGVARLAESGEGRASFLILGRAAGACAPLETPNDGRVVGRLTDLYQVGLPDGESIKLGLCDALVVRTLKDALAISETRDTPIVTLDGEVVRGAWVEGGRGGRGFLAPRREVKELKEREVAIDERLLELKAREGEVAARIEAVLSPSSRPKTRSTIPRRASSRSITRRRPSMTRRSAPTANCR